MVSFGECFLTFGVEGDMAGFGFLIGDVAPRVHC